MGVFYEDGHFQIHVTDEELAQDEVQYILWLMAKRHIPDDMENVIVRARYMSKMSWQEVLAKLQSKSLDELVSDGLGFLLEE